MNKRITIRIDGKIEVAIQNLAAREMVTAKSKQEVFRYIVEDWLAARGYLDCGPDKPTD